MIDIKQVDPFLLPSIAIKDRDSMPDIPAIYFAISKENEILYIGRAVLLQKRWKLHHRVKQLESFKDVNIAWLACSDLVDQELKSLEEECIRHFNPTLNQAVIPRDLRAPGAMFNIRDLPIGADEQLDSLAEYWNCSRKQVFLIALDRFWKEAKQEREAKMITGNVIEKDGDFTMTIDGIVARVYDKQKEIFSSGDHGEAQERFVEEATTRDLLQQQEAKKTQS